MPPENDHHVYDKDDKNPVTRPDLHSLESAAHTPHQKDGSSEGKKGGEGSEADASSSDSSSKERSLFNPRGEGGKGGRSGSSGGQFGFNPKDELTGGGKVRQFAKKHRRKGIAGIIAAALSALLLVGFTAIIPYELVNIEKDLIKDVAKIEQRFEKKAAQKVMGQLLKRLQKKYNGTVDEKQQIADDEKAAGELTKAMDDFPITDPEVVDALAKSGITVETDAQGNFKGLSDAAGNDITDKVATDSTVYDDVARALPEWSVNQLESFEPLMTEHAGSSFSGLPEDTTADKVDKAVQDDITKGASGEELVNAESGQESDGQQPSEEDKKNNPNAAQEASNLNDQGGELGKALDATNEALAKGETGADATKAGVDSFNLGDPLFASTLATMACSLKKGVDEASKARVPLIMNLLTRHFTLILSLADQLKLGKINGGSVNKVMQIFNGDPAAAASLVSGGSTQKSEASLPFTSSAGWQRATGGIVNSNPKQPGYTPDISKSALPTVNSGTKIVSEVDNVVDAVPGANLSCSALTSPFGFIVQGVAGVGQLIGDIGSFGVSQAAITGGIIAAQEVLTRVVLPDIIKYFTPVGIYGGEDSVQWLNNSHAGGTLAYSDYARGVGGQPLTNDQANNLTTAANKGQLSDQQKLPWSTRVFALSNSDSLVSKLTLYAPSGINQAVTNTASLFANLPSTLAHNFGLLLIPSHAFADNSAQNPGEAYGITEYGLMDEQVNKYNSVANEKYLKTKVTYGSNSATRLDMAGDPFQYEDGKVDSSSTDLLHCFLQGYASGSDPTANSDSNDSICASMGNYDYDNHKPQPMTDDNVAVAYCDYLTNVSSSPSQGCINAVKPQLDDDIGHFQQYILDAHVMTGFNSLGNK